MAQIDVAVTRHMRAAPAAVYGIVSDYHNGHPRILPPRYFGPLSVVAGGTGAGTRIRFTMKGFGREQEMVADIEEPEPGRVLLERYPATGGVTTFTVETSSHGSTVTIRTCWSRPGVQGMIERMFAPSYLRKVFRDELDMLQALAESPGETNA